MKKSVTPNKESVVDKYFNSFNNHSVEEMANLMDNDIRLVDWDIDVVGKNNVLQTIQQIFDKTSDISIEMVKSFSSENIVGCELIINNNLKVFDVIEFNDCNKIVEIRAYKQ